MVILQSRPKRKPSGARYKSKKIPRLHQKGNQATLTKIDTENKKVKAAKGGNVKTKLLATEVAYVVDKSGKQQKTTIKTLKENAANRHFVRRNIMTLGAIIETDLGLAKITNRPGQDGSVKAVLV